ncbi:MAG: hypothetical protein EBU59_07390 [Planctomycetia bacterium]|nr:hypothetical protein [Planctomycetia bacterium]
MVSDSTMLSLAELTDVKQAATSMRQPDRHIQWFKLRRCFRGAFIDPKLRLASRGGDGPTQVLSGQSPI